MKGFQEKNRKALIKGIQSLPEYEAPTYLWADIASGLDQEKKMHTALKELPQYSAPEKVWKGIANVLDRSARPGIYRYVNRSARWAAAAVISGLLICSWWLIHRESSATTTFAYSEEIQMQSSIAEDWNTEDQTMSLVIQQATQSPIADPETVNRLKTEYQELTEARLEVEVMLEKYGKDEYLLKEVARIERERSQVIKELATWI